MSEETSDDAERPLTGANQGIRHAPADLTDDIHTLMESLDENNIYRIQKGRILDDDDEPVRMSSKSAFKILQRETRTHFLSLTKPSKTSRHDKE